MWSENSLVLSMCSKLERKKMLEGPSPHHSNKKREGIDKAVSFNPQFQNFLSSQHLLKQLVT
jgi:hypothetical protein